MDGEEFTIGVDQANMLNIVGTRELRRLQNPIWSDELAGREEFFKKALQGLPVRPADSQIVQEFHDYCLDQMNLQTEERVSIWDWSPIGFVPRQMGYKYENDSRGELITMEQQIFRPEWSEYKEGFIPEQRPKSRIKVEGIFDGLYPYPGALNYWYNLLDENQQKFVRDQGLNHKFGSHAQGVKDGKIWNDMVKRCYSELKFKGLRPWMLLGVDTLFGFTQGASNIEFLDDISQVWFPFKVTFESPGLLYMMQKGLEAVQDSKSLTINVNDYMTSGTARGSRVYDISNPRISSSSNKTQIVVTSGNCIYALNQDPLGDLILKALEKNELTKNRAIITTSTEAFNSLIPFARKKEYQSKRVYNYGSYREREQWTKEIMEMTGYKTGLDQEGFDRNLSKNQLYAISETDPMALTFLMYLMDWESYCEVGVYSTRWANGMPSGLALTSIGDSMINQAQLYAISTVCGKQMRGTVVQGDDVLTVVQNQTDIKIIINCSNDLGAKMKPEKISASRVRGEFLRTMWDAEDKIAYGYLARAMASGRWMKPWNSERENSTIAVLSDLQQYGRRGANKNQLAIYGQAELNSTTVTPKFKKKQIAAMLQHPHIMEITYNEKTYQEHRAPLFTPDISIPAFTTMKVRQIKEILDEKIDLKSKKIWIPMIPGLTPSQRAVFNELTPNEKAQVALLLSSYEQPFYYEDQQQPKMPTSWVIIDFENAPIMYSQYTEAVTYKLAITRGAQRLKKQEFYYLRAQPELFADYQIKQ